MVDDALVTYRHTDLYAFALSHIGGDRKGFRPSLVHWQCQWVNMEWYCSAFLFFSLGHFEKGQYFYFFWSSCHIRGSAGITCPLQKTEKCCMSERAVKGWVWQIRMVLNRVWYYLTSRATTEYSSGLGITVELCSIRCAMTDDVNAAVTLLQFVSLFDYVLITH